MHRSQGFFFCVAAELSLNFCFFPQKELPQRDQASELQRALCDMKVVSLMMLIWLRCVTRLSEDDSGGDGEWWSEGDRPPSLRPSFFFPLSGFGRSYQPLPLPWCAAVVRHASLSKVAAQSDVFLLLPWLYFMPSCLFSSSHPLVFFSLSVILTKKKKKRESKHRNWNFSGPANNCMHLDFSFPCVHSLP